MFFGGLFCAYLVYRRWYFPDFAAASKSINMWLGATNTAVLICSSLTVVLAVWAAQTARRTLLIVSLALTMLLGLVFLGVKADEYYGQIRRASRSRASFSFENVPVPGIGQSPVSTPRADYLVYFVMTGLHGNTAGNFYRGVDHGDWKGAARSQN